VAACEPLAVTPVRARFGAFNKQIAVTALPEGGQLRRIIGIDGQRVLVPPTGLLMSRRLLHQLGAEVGDRVTLETLEGRQRQAALPVSAALDDEMGLNVYASIPTLTAFLGEAPVMSMALLRVQPGRQAAVEQRLDQMPTVIGVTSRSAAIVDFEKVTGESMRVMTMILALLSAVLAIAVVYNGARVALAERARDLASLRVLGFTRGEVSRILFGEMGIAVGLGVPLGLLLGRWLAGLTVGGVAADEFRLPLVITAGTYFLSALVVVGASLTSALQMRRLIDRLDLVEVLKTRE
jgi:putative ABC transport system permease protein